MVSKIKSIWLWVISILLFIGIAYFQRVTGPTKPVRGKVEIKGKEYSYKLLRTFDGDKAPVKLELEDKSIKGTVKFRVFRSKGEWTVLAMKPEEENIVAYLPHMSPAGKVEYNVYVSDGENEVLVNEEPVVLRYKGAVPSSILIPHVLFMILAILFSLRAGIEVLFKGRRTFNYATVTVITLFLGGLVLGPIVQNYAFGDYWTGWPFGGDWTDNKTIIAFIFWVIAWLVLRKNRENKLWTILAVIVLLSIYMIPHSMGGSELDAETGKVTTGLKK
jgi:hypothetical protein